MLQDTVCPTMKRNFPYYIVDDFGDRVRAISSSKFIWPKNAIAKLTFVTQQERRKRQSWTDGTDYPETSSKPIVDDYGFSR